MSKPVAEGGCRCGATIGVRAHGPCRRDLLPLPRLSEIERCSRLALRQVPDRAGGDQVGSAEGLLFIAWRQPVLLRRLRGAAFVRDERLPGEIYVPVWVFDEPEEFEPEMHGWISQRLGWLDLRDDLPRYQESSKPR